MSDESESDELDLDKLPGTLLEPFRILDSQLVTMHMRWQILMQLLESDKTVDLLKETAPLFFEQFFAVWQEYFIVQLFRIADEQKRKRLSIRTLFDGLNKIDKNHPALVKLEPLLKDAHSKCKKLHGVRHRLLAHLDKETMLGTHRHELKEVFMGDLRQALDAITKFMQAFFLHFTGTERGYANVMMFDDAKTLLFWLARGYEYSQLEDEDGATYINRLRQGRFGDL